MCPSIADILDVFTVGIEHMVIVEFGEPLEVDTGQAPLPRTDIETPETTVPVDEQKGAVERPVRRLDEHRVGFEQKLWLSDLGSSHPDLCSLSDGERSIWHVNLYPCLMQEVVDTSCCRSQRMAGPTAPWRSCCHRCISGLGRVFPCSQGCYPVSVMRSSCFSALPALAKGAACSAATP